MDCFETDTEAIRRAHASRASQRPRTSVSTCHIDARTTRLTPSDVIRQALDMSVPNSIRDLVSALL